MDILERIDGLEAKFHEVSLLITDPSVIADQARYVRLNREYRDLERVLVKVKMNSSFSIVFLCLLILCY